jgi:hypothetical protein
MGSLPLHPYRRSQDFEVSPKTLDAAQRLVGRREPVLEAKVQVAI